MARITLKSINELRDKTEKAYEYAISHHDPNVPLLRRTYYELSVCSHLVTGKSRDEWSQQYMARVNDICSYVMRTARIGVDPRRHPLKWQGYESWLADDTQEVTP